MSTVQMFEKHYNNLFSAISASSHYKTLITKASGDKCLD